MWCGVHFDHGWCLLVQDGAREPQVPLQSRGGVCFASVCVDSSQEFKLADIGEGIAEVTLTEWFVKEGDSVKEMDNLCSVESDKASVELSSPFTGKVKKVHHAVGGVVKVGATLVEIETAGAPAPVASSPVPQAASSAVPAPVATKSSTSSAAPSPASSTKAPGVLATPKVRALARAEGIDLNKVTWRNFLFWALSTLVVSTMLQKSR